MNKPDIEVFITVHDQNIIILQEECQKYKCLNGCYRYVFVGAGSTEKLTSYANVIIARDLPDNIENHPCLVDFTAWYSIIKNNIIDTQYLILIQYDTVLTNDFLKQSLDMICANKDSLIGYVPFDMRNENFLERNIGSEPLYEAIKSKYGYDIYLQTKKYLFSVKNAYWPSSNNILLSKETLDDFVSWFSPLITIVVNYNGAGHAFERSIKFYSIERQVENLYLDNVLEHYQLNSHGTQNFDNDKMEKMMGKLMKNKFSKKMGPLKSLIGYFCK